MGIHRPNIDLRLAGTDDLHRLDEVRQAAFAPVFASFRSILGKDLYQLAQAREDEAQGALLASPLAPASGWEVYVADQGGVASVLSRCGLTRIRG